MRLSHAGPSSPSARRKRVPALRSGTANSLARPAVRKDFHSSGTHPLLIVALFLTPQPPRRRIQPLYSGACQRSARGRQRALLARMDGSVHQSGVPGPRTLAARGLRPGGALQQLRRAPAQRAAAIGLAAQNAAAPADGLPARARSLDNSPAAAALALTPRRSVPEIFAQARLARFTPNFPSSRAIVYWGTVSRGTHPLSCGGPGSSADLRASAPGARADRHRKSLPEIGRSIRPQPNFARGGAYGTRIQFN